MGNEQSHLPGIEIEEKAVEVANFWTQHSASIFNGENVSHLSVFSGELFVNSSLWTSQTPLEKSSKNLMIYRHPCIIKYISSWQKNSKFYLAVEEVTPLSHIISTLNTLQICIGLHSILKATCFLHEKAFASHNNICTSSIYVTKDGTWKLGGMEYLCKYMDLTCDYLNKTRSNRYDKAIDSNESSNIEKCQRKDIIDIFAFGVLVSEVLRSRNNDEIPTLTKFKEFCKTTLLATDVSQRPKLNILLEHEFFKHEFILIHSYLVELPLKNDEQKTAFFLTLTEKLRGFSEEIVASQLSGLLLSRMVLLNKTAQNNLLPNLLCTRKESEETSTALFTEKTFKTYVTPKLLKIFLVRDAQIRLCLLNHFPHYRQTFTKEELQSNVLPELLVGIKDTNDHLVSVTLRTLADLVPILGAATVIGGKRAKLFNEGRPITHSVRKSSKIKGESLPIQSSQVLLETDHISITSSVLELINRQEELPERPRPDGEEGETSTEGVDLSVGEDLDNWEDWDNGPNEESNNVAFDENPRVIEEFNSNENGSGLEAGNDIILKLSKTQEHKTNGLPDITELDIKNQLTNGQSNEEFNFFQDMEPVIDSGNKFLMSDEKILNNLSKPISSKLELKITDDFNDDGWEDGDWE